MKTTLILLGIVLLIGGAILFTHKKAPTGGMSIAPANNVSIIDGKQIVQIAAKGGYSPQISIAKAGMPTIIRFDTNGTFDCSSSIRIPSMNISKNLPQSGSTDIDIGTSKLATLQGTCGMGMYPFEIKFQG